MVYFFKSVQTVLITMNLINLLINQSSYLSLPCLPSLF